MKELHPEMAVDIEKAIAAKFPNKKIPKCFINFMKRFIHQDYMNDFLVRGYKGVEFCHEAMKYLDIEADVKGVDRVKVPEGAKITFACNHPLGGADGIIIVSTIGKYFGKESRLLVNDFLMNIKAIRHLSIPVSKTGGLQVRNLPQLIEEIYNSNDPVMIFPSGICSRRIKGKVQDVPWSKNFIKMSRKTNRWVVPVHFIGQNSKRFYNVAALCHWLKLKFNFAMLLLPDELYRARHSRYKLIFGEPMAPDTFDKSKTDLEWAAYVREKVYELE
ncbi:MAG: 1-acyl-sn-glycerol-3-phosphate acyltransferase [Candidatus Cryptobacteroides sp.]|jgi:putative hemolysin